MIFIQLASTMLGDSDVIGKPRLKTKMAGKTRPFFSAFSDKLHDCFGLLFEHERDLIGAIYIHRYFTPVHQTPK